MSLEDNLWFRLIILQIRPCGCRALLPQELENGRVFCNRLQGNADVFDCWLQCKAGYVSRAETRVSKANNMALIYVFIPATKLWAKRLYLGISLILSFLVAKCPFSCKLFDSVHDMLRTKGPNELTSILKVTLNAFKRLLGIENPQTYLYPRFGLKDASKNPNKHYSI